MKSGCGFSHTPRKRLRMALRVLLLSVAADQRMQLNDLPEFPEGKLHFGNFFHQLHFLLIHFSVVSTHVVFAPFVGFHCPLYAEISLCQAKMHNKNSKRLYILHKTPLPDPPESFTEFAGPKRGICLNGINLKLGFR